MATSVFSPRTARFSLPADPYSASVLRRFVREIAGSTNLCEADIIGLQCAATDALYDALSRKGDSEGGRIALKIDAREDEVSISIIYRPVHFAPAEFFSPS